MCVSETVCECDCESVRVCVRLCVCVRVCECDSVIV